MRRTFLFLVLVAALQPCGAQRWFVTDFGAEGDGMTLCTRSLQAAIDSANATYNRSGEKQTVILPPGQYVSGTLYLKSGVTLMLSEGCTLLGSTNPFDYVKDPYCRWTALIFAVKQHDIGITGKGTIDGRGWEVANNLVQYIHLGLVNDPLKYDRPNEGNRPENILVKVLLNEHEATLPVKPVQGPYYRWSDLKRYYEKKLDTVINWSVN